MKIRNTTHRNQIAKVSIGLLSVISAIAAVVGGGSAVVGTKYLSTLPGSAGEVPPIVTPGEIVDEPAPPKELTGFTMGEIPADEPVDTIKVTITVGAEGEALEEQVNLHLGVGFPFRLYPVGGDSREPAFAAFPQESSIKRGINKIEPGESATFEFVAREIPGQDELGTTPQLMSGLKAGDLQSIGFASQGSTGWELAGYKIEVNDKLFAENDSVNLMPAVLLNSTQDEIDDASPEYQALLNEIENLEAYVNTGLAMPADKAELETKKAKIAENTAPLTTLAQQTEGISPWFTENAEGFQVAPVSGQKVNDVEITLIAGGGEQPGTKNPVFFIAGNRKFLLTSEGDPFRNKSEPQKFRLSEDFLASNPVTQDDLNQIGVGVIGNEERFDDVPDRAKLQRISIIADGAPLYDSENNADDRRALSVFWLIPPAHLNGTGEVVKNTEKPDEKYAWISGTVVPAEDIIIPGPKIPEPIGPGGTDIVPGGGLLVGPTIPELPDPLEPENKVDNPAHGLNLPDDVKDLVAKSQGGLVTPYSSDAGITQNSLIIGGKIPPNTNRIPGGTGGGGFNPFNPGSRGNSGTTIGQITNLLSLLNNIVKPFVNPSSTTNPTSTTVTISNVNFVSSTTRLGVGQTPVITFNVTGTTAVPQYRVNLLACLPDQPGFILPGQPVSTITRAATLTGGKATIPLPPIADPKTAALGIVLPPGRKHHELYVRAHVTAMNGAAVPQAISGAALGAMMPLFPANSFDNTKTGIYTLRRGPGSGIASGNYSTFRFTTSPVAGPNAGTWTKTSLDAFAFPAPFSTQLGTGWPLAGSVAPAFQLFGNTNGAMGGAKFESVETGFTFGPNAAFFNSSARSTGGRAVRMVFEGAIPYTNHPNASQKLATIKGFRLLGHYGFIGNNSLPGGSADLGISVSLSQAGGAGVPTPLSQPAINNVNNTTPNEFFTIENEAPVVVPRPVANTGAVGMFPIDIPIDFDALDTLQVGPVNAATIAANYPPSVPAAVNVDVGTSALNLTGALPLETYQARKTIPGNRGNFTVTVTLVMGTSRANPTDSLGVFGLRLVPDFR
ncbi:MAG: hypothetical protein P1V20_18920 [Verrucomicrobiales bacterium]|nr:hypothetical protein [Verrucomicrobiales bacterium]